MTDRLQRMSAANANVHRRTRESVPPWYAPAKPYRGADVPGVPVGAAFATFAALMDASSLLVNDYFRHDRRQQDARTTAFLARTSWDRMRTVGERVAPVLRAAEDAALVKRRAHWTFDVVITDRLTGAQQVKRVHVPEDHSLTLDIAPGREEYDMRDGHWE